MRKQVTLQSPCCSYSHLPLAPQRTLTRSGVAGSEVFAHYEGFDDIAKLPSPESVPWRSILCGFYICTVCFNCKVKTPPNLKFRTLICLFRSRFKCRALNKEGQVQFADEGTGICEACRVSGGPEYPLTPSLCPRDLV